VDLQRKKEGRMALINTRSLARTVDRINEALFFKKAIPAKEKKVVASWIATRQGLKLSYAGMFAPTPYDMKHGMRVFTGERITSSAALRHVLGEESCRVMLQLKVNRKDVLNALERAERNMRKRIDESRESFYRRGIYCCGTCTASVWRHLAAGGLNDRRRRIAVGVKALKKYRDGEGRWSRFPFYYTLLALSEIDTDAAKEEKRYAAPVIERFLGRKAKGSKYDKRRRIVAERILGQI
jgi:hypothetical protein